MTTYYGPLWQSDGLNNQQIGGPNGPYTMAIKDRSQHTGTLQSIDLYRKSTGTQGASGYWDGNGGSWTVRCESDNAGVPSGSLISAGATVTATTPSNTVDLVQRFTFGTSISDTIGTLRHFVILNADGSPTTNFVSCNCIDLETAFNPVQPTYLEADRCVLRSTGGAFTINRDRYPIFALNYSDSTVTGVSTYNALSSSGQKNIGGNDKARLNFTPTSTISRVTAAHFRIMKRSTTSAALVVNLRDLTNGNVVLETATIAAANVNTTTDLTNGYGMRFVDLTFSQNRTFVSGNNYSIEVTSTEATNKYITFPTRRGGSGFGANFAANDRFLDGYWEETTDGTNWTLSNSSQEYQAQAYFDVADGVNVVGFYIRSR